MTAVKASLSPHLGLCAGHQVLELDDFVVDGRAVALLDGVVGRALLALGRQASRLAADGDAVDGDLVGVHHDGHRGQDGSSSHEGLEKQKESSGVR